MTFFTRFATPLAIGLAALALNGCAASATSSFVAEAPRSGVLAEVPADRARVVFIRPSDWASDMRIHIIDEHGSYLGDSLPGSYFAADVKPGKRMFVAWSGHTAALYAELEAGKEYFVEVAPRFEWPRRRSLRLFPVSQRLENWDELHEWLALSRPTTVDREGGQRWLDGHRDQAMRRVQAAEAIMKGYDEDERAEHTLKPSDARTM
jgi:hypothetical protein